MPRCPPEQLDLALQHDERCRLAHCPPSSGSCPWEHTIAAKSSDLASTWSTRARCACCRHRLREPPGAAPPLGRCSATSRGGRRRPAGLWQRPAGPEALGASGPRLPAGHSCGCREAGGRGAGPFAAVLTALRLGRARRLGRASSRRSRCRACSLLSNIGPSNLGRRRRMAASCLLSRSSTRRDQVEASSKRRSDARRGLTAHILCCC